MNVHIGNQMFVHGGMTDDDEILGDSAVFSIVPQKWYNLTVSEDTLSPALSSHTCCLVLPNEQRFNPKLIFYKLPELRVGRRGEVKVISNF